MPLAGKQTVRSWWKKHVAEKPQDESNASRKVFFFCDEFTNYNDTEIGIKAILLLEKLGYSVVLPEHLESGRTWLSKGLLRKAKDIVHKNLALLHPLISETSPLVGVEPSAILTFRDEYIDLANDEWLPRAKEMAKNVMTIEEFIASEIDKGNIKRDRFKKEIKKIRLHGHCQQKALSSVEPTRKILQFPEGSEVSVIPSGCCGMAGSFGYEKEHFDVSMKIGELVLFPAVRSAGPEEIIAAPGTSCRHQVKDGTGTRAYHPVEILYDALQ